MVRTPCCSKDGLNRGAWTREEDQILTSYVKAHGPGKWSRLPKEAGLNRCGKSCRLRWMNYLRPDIQRGNIRHEEEDLIIRLHKLLGNRRLPGRTDNEIKNYWNTHLKKKVQRAMAPSDQAAEGVHGIKQLEIETRIIKTKAVRCTRAFIDPEIDSSEVREDCSHKDLGVHGIKQPEIETRVIKTKAVRCTRVFIDPEIGSSEVREDCSHKDPFPPLEDPLLFNEEKMEDWMMSEWGQPHLNWEMSEWGQPFLNWDFGPSSCFMD